MSTSMKEQSPARIDKETRSTKAQFDVALFTKEYDTGLTTDEAKILLDMIPKNEGIIPLEIQGSANSVAMGFITNSAGDKIDYEYRPKQGFHAFVTSILNDKDKKSSDGVYTYKGLKVFLF